jgi:predicted Fe-Mo cluster-binding NifX family protein
MKIAICASQKMPDANISNDFGGANYYYLIDIENPQSNEEIINHLSKSTTGAEIFNAQLVISKGVKVVICGSCENNALKLFKEANVKVIENVSGPISEYLVKFTLNNETILND